jgi:hypothetical protein
MLHGHLFSGCAAIACLAASACAGTIQDPTAGVESDNFSSAISTFSGTFDPTANNGILGLYNDTGAIITALFLHTTIAHNLSAADISLSFNCNSGAANPFFLYCGFDYIGSSGSLTISYYGVNPPDGDEFRGTDPEVGEQEGIPPADVACLIDQVSCKGHFAFVFNNNFLMTEGASNGWVPQTKSSADGVTLLFNGQPLFDPPKFTASPEPGSLLLLGGGIFALGVLSRRRLWGTVLPAAGLSVKLLFPR